MKQKILFLTIVTILLSCKKSNSPKDYSASIKDKTWWGTLTNTGETVQYYSVHFNSNKTLLWSQLAGDYDGQWDVSGKQLTMILGSSGVQITATISENNTLTAITDNTGASEVNSGELLANPNLTLDNTTWKGTYFNGSTQQPLLFSFSSGSNITIKFGNFPTNVHVYTRTPSGGAIRFDPTSPYPFFGVLTSSTLLKGSEQDYRFSWTAIKQ